MKRSTVASAGTTRALGSSCLVWVLGASFFGSVLGASFFGSVGAGWGDAVAPWQPCPAIAPWQPAPRLPNSPPPWHPARLNSPPPWHPARLLNKPPPWHPARLNSPPKHPALAPWQPAVAPWQPPLFPKAGVSGVPATANISTIPYIAMLLRGVWTYQSRSLYVFRWHTPTACLASDSIPYHEYPLSTSSQLRDGRVFAHTMNLRIALAPVNGKVGSLAATGENRGLAETIARVRAILAVEPANRKVPPAIGWHYETCLSEVLQHMWCSLLRSVEFGCIISPEIRHNYPVFAIRGGC